MLWEFFERPATEVETNIALMNQRADAALDKANANIDALGKVALPLDAPAPPNLDLPAINIPNVVAPKPPSAGSFGEVGDISLGPMEDLWTTAGLSLGAFLDDIPQFAPTVVSPSIPEPPAAIDASHPPARPEVDEVTLPDAPSVVMPDIGELLPVSVPEFTFPTLPTFDASAPEFTAVAPSPEFVWSEPVYESEVLDDVKSRVRAMLAGGTGLPLVVQQALFDAARDREDQTAFVAKQQAYDEWAGRGFSMPPGMLVAAVDQANERARLAANSLERELLTKAAQWEIENLRTAVQQGIALEGVLLNVFSNAAQRSFEAAKHRVDAEMHLYDAAVTLFNARQSAYQTAAQVFKIRVDGELAQLEVFKAEIQAEIAKGQFNEQQVKVYQARLEGVTKLIDVYKARMQGAQVQADVIKSRFDAYRSDVQAFAETINARKVEFDAYESQVKGEGVKAQWYEAQARAFAETVRAYEGRANVKTAYINARIAAVRASTDKWTAQLQGEREQVQANLAAIQARTAAFTADVGRYREEISGVNETRRIELATAEARLRNQLAYYETRIREYDQAMARTIQRAQLIIDAIKGASSTSAALATGAMSAIHVQAAMHGNATVSDSQSYSVSIERKGADAA